MATISYDEVNLMLRLYDLRREPKLRQARSWYLDYFHLDLEEIAGRPLHDLLRAESLPHRAAQVTPARITTRDVLLEVVIKDREERRHIRQRSRERRLQGFIRRGVGPRERD